MSFKPASRIAVVSAYEALEGVTGVARSYYEAFGELGWSPKWYQCIASARRNRYDLRDQIIEGIPLDLQSVTDYVNGVLIYPRKIAKIPETWVLLTDPILMAATDRLPHAILIVHDLIDLGPHRTGWLSEQLLRWLMKFANRARHIICVSEATRESLIRTVNPVVPIHVLYPYARVSGDARRHLENSLNRIGKQEGLCLTCIAADYPYKNLAFVAQLARHLNTRHTAPRVQFLVVSRLRRKTEAYFRRLGSANVRVMTDVPDIASVYEESDVLIHPSRVEGFGMPMAEAMQFGLPVLASDDPALSEVLGTGGVTVPSGDLARWTIAIENLLDPERYREASLASATRGREFTTSVFRNRLLREFVPLLTE